MRMGGVRRRVTDYTFNYLPQQKFRGVQSADFVFILEQDRKRGDKKQPSKKEKQCNRK